MLNLSEDTIRKINLSWTEGTVTAIQVANPDCLESLEESILHSVEFKCLIRLDLENLGLAELPAAEVCPCSPAGSSACGSDRWG